MQHLLLFRVPCPCSRLGQGQGDCLSGPACALCGACPGDEMHRAYECAALQMLRDDMPTLFQGVHSMHCCTWQDNMVLMSRFVHDAMRMVRAAGSGDESDV